MGEVVNMGEFLNNTENRISREQILESKSLEWLAAADELNEYLQALPLTKTQYKELGKLIAKWVYIAEIDWYSQGWEDCESEGQ